MNLADKVAAANTIAAYLDGTELDLADELRARGWPELVADGDFGQLLGDRCWRCPDCFAWIAHDGDWVLGHPPCPDCDEDDYE